MASNYNFLRKQDIQTPVKNETWGILWSICSSANCKFSDLGLDICNVNIDTETDFVSMHCRASKWDYLI